ncbi:hypothetical protein PMAC_000449 [Pneumocystis sp. 'macacae']|nr:hypothetical protein PMAC_000449 [Pneumocystis sp. 'macacae']
MVFDAAKPIKKNKSFSSMESVIDEERKEVLKFLETREMQLSMGLKNKLRSSMPCDVFDFKCLESDLEVGFKSGFVSDNTFNVSSSRRSSSKRSSARDCPQNNRSSSLNDVELNSYKTCFRFSNYLPSQSSEIFTKLSSIENEPKKKIDNGFSENYDSANPIKSNCCNKDGLDGYIKPASSYLSPTIDKLESLSLSIASEADGNGFAHESSKNSYSSISPSRILKTVVNKAHSFKNSSNLCQSEVFSHTNTGFSFEHDNDVDEYKKMQNMKIDMGTIIFTEDRTIRTIKRGEYSSSFSKPRKIRSYLVPIDLSSESLYALEWAIGTVVRDYDTMMIVEAIDKDDKDDKGIVELEKERLAAMEEICQITQKLLKKTRLILQIEIEIIHHKTPKHLLTEMIDYLEPTLVILGSRGRSSLKGVILGSFSNYIVNKSSVPVMVARKKPMKSKSKQSVFGTNIRMVNNLLTKAIID